MAKPRIAYQRSPTKCPLNVTGKVGSMRFFWKNAIFYMLCVGRKTVLGGKWSPAIIR